MSNSKTTIPGFKFCFKSLEYINDFNAIQEKCDLPIEHFYIFFVSDISELVRYTCGTGSFKEIKSIAMNIDEKDLHTLHVRDISFLYGTINRQGPKNVGFIVDKYLSTDKKFFREFLQKINKQRKDHIYFLNFVYFWDTFIINYHIHNFKNMIKILSWDNYLLKDYINGISIFYEKYKLPYEKSVFGKEDDDIFESTILFITEDMVEYDSITKRLMLLCDRHIDFMTDTLIFMKKIDKFFVPTTYLAALFVAGLFVYAFFIR
ncbi:hypothetical protein TBLA_0E00810 [Henningerozyma blattae CBS 6284]|uniref:Uncharacterized protein n=1 Tax=Henningerozyma blattae (strain ATCC 34711 / CBS 6284 / DSM 70876 / NBRC 10599 / NRRL Y-10934 / UCD 77-7) TaxID=1071380 RepID=I2H440_HENB6|nr:hypothetical protein TBLA_0E00810 [Tetrapisispora blattae CBS 6284]CCH61142.1 hypothetical protein TBLA_0E00810 [Tetrapisispora blattae CBS 6284]